MSTTRTEPAAPIESLPQQFQQLVAQWRKETMVLSDAGKIMRHPAFQAIIAMGDDALPLILRELESGASLLVWTLPKITGENPVPPGNDGKIDKLTEAWMQWGREGTRMSAHLAAIFPGLLTTPFRITSSATDKYNCIAWGAGRTDRWWWPEGESPNVYWPPGVPRELTLDAFSAALGTVGYVAGADESLEPAIEKVALFVDAAGVPTHAARQLASGLWTSKLGQIEDIEHELRALEGIEYGAVALILRRPTSENPRTSKGSPP